jgi:ABC-type Fe3+-hydroxamate transport system substrate-binding protein
MRIVSCVPSISELVVSFDAGQLVGRTRFCTEPAQIRRVPVVGGTKNLNLDTIRSLKPDVILAVKEENSKDQIEKLMQEFRVIVFEIGTMEDAIQMIIDVGGIMEKENLAKDLCRLIRDRFENLFFQVKIPVLYLIWENPVMTIGGDTFIHDLLSKAGLQNVFDGQNRYPVVDLEKDLPGEPEIIILSSEPYPFRQKHQARFRKRFPHATVVLADGSLFSWYGSRMAQFPDYVLKFREQCGF